jgi:hypothetical protein
MAKIILHIGVHKTASTHLQYNLELNREYFERKGLKYFRFHQIEGLRGRAIRLRRKIHKEDLNIKEDFNFIKSKVNKELNDYDYAIVSYEGIMGELNLHLSKAIYPDAEAMLKLYAKMLNNHEVTVAFSIRNYVDFITSTYKYNLYQGLPLRMSEYLKDFSWKKDRWTTIVDALDKNFNDKLIWNYEVYKQSSDKILYWLLKNLDVEINLQRICTSNKKRNSSAINEVTSYHYAINKCLNNIYINNKLFLRICKKINSTINGVRRNAINISLAKHLPECMDVDLKDIEAKYRYEEEVNNLSKRKDFFTPENSISL